MKFCLPDRVLEQHLVALGKTGAGKSSALRHIVEHFLHRKARVCVIDPKGDWWGLKYSSDGKSEGFPVIAFGDFKEPKAVDIPINERSGKQVAELIVTGNRPCVIGFRGWMPSAQAKFWIDFASVIFNSNQSGGLNLVIDEIQNFAPKERVGFGDENMALHWTKRILSEGRGLGLTIFCGSQRPQSVHNGVLTQCETLLGMRLTHDADCKAVEDWLKRTRDKSRREEVLVSIPEMPRGEAWVWSPEIGFGPERIKFPMFETFDSFAPPQLQRKLTLSDWSSVDLDQVKARLAKVIEEVTQNDPSALKRQIAELKREMATAAKAAPVAPPKMEKVEVPVLGKEHEKLLGSLETWSKDLSQQIDAFHHDLQKVLHLRQEIVQKLEPHANRVRMIPVIGVANSHHAASPAAVTPRPRVRIPSVPQDPDTRLGKCERSILTALAQYPQGRTKTQIAVLTGYAQNGGGFANALGKLTTLQYINRGEILTITDAGLGALGDKWQPLPTGRALAEYWMGQLPKAERSILEFLVAVHPDSALKADVAANTGYAVDGGGFANALGKLRTLELITRGDPIKASDDFFQ
jgi:uncharacterized protein